jgi:integrase
MAAILEYHVWYLERFGETKSDWYVFPWGKPFPSDPTRHVVSIDTAWRAIKTKAGIEGRARFHDQRHTWKSDLGTNPKVSNQTILNMGGWSDARMLERYGHAAMKESRKAVKGLERKKPTAQPVAKTLVKEAVKGGLIH